jgi:AcrR family transcriptional regulator
VNQTQQRIAEAFGAQVARVGYAKANLDDVARELRISKKTIYVHFDGKRDIYAHLVEEQASAERARLKAAVADLPTCAAKVETLMRSVIGSARAHVERTTREEWLQEYEIAADAFRKANGDLMRELVQDGMAAGEFPAGDAVLVEKMLAAMIVEYLLMVNADETYDRDDELVGRMLRFIG